MKKSLLLALAAVSAAILAVPAFASAQTAHLDSLAGSNFTVTGGSSTLNETGSAVGVSGTAIDGSGTFTNTTTGTISLTFTNVTEGVFGTKCGSTAQGHPESTGVVTTTELTFHLIMLATNKPGILITPNAATGVFAHFKCLGIEKTVTGNGIIGTIIEPACGVASTTAKIKFRKTANGHQEHTLYTGVSYTLHTNASGNPKASMDVPGDSIIHFEAARKIECTHVA